MGIRALMALGVDRGVRRGLHLLFGEGFANPRFAKRVLLRAVVQQKLLRHNAHVAWPVHPSTTVKGAHGILRGSRSPGMAVGCYLDGRNGIELGDNVWIGPNVHLISMNHDACDYEAYLEAPPIRIGRDCWLGAGAKILAGVKLGDHVVVAAGSVVTRSIEESDVLVAGVPARVVKKLPPYRGRTD